MSDHVMGSLIKSIGLTPEERKRMLQAMLQAMNSENKVNHEEDKSKSDQNKNSGRGDIDPKEEEEDFLDFDDDRDEDKGSLPPRSSLKEQTSESGHEKEKDKEKEKEGDSKSQTEKGPFEGSLDSEPNDSVPIIVVFVPPEDEDKKRR